MTDSSPTRFDLLTEPLISIRTRKEDTKRSLPGVLEVLGVERDVTFPALRRHQKHAWHAFLVQLAVMALHRGGENDPKQTADRWTDLLLTLSDGNRNAWRLVVDDLSEPAFMQPPVPEGSKENWKSIKSPGALDMLVTAKNHDLKAQLVPAGESEHWMLALISLQTMEGFLGAGKWGIARMNGGFGSRPSVALVRKTGFHDRFLRDTEILLRRRDELVSDVWPYPPTGGKVLLWTDSWDGESSLSLTECDPFFVEICRRVRLHQRDSKICAFDIPTKKPRVSAKELKGVTGDPWTPVLNDNEGVKALTVPSSGFSYTLVSDLLFSGRYSQGLAWRQPEENDNMVFLASAVTRGQGKTEGFHECRIKVPSRICTMMDTPNGRDRLAQDAQRQIKIADTARKKVLRFALCVVSQGAPETGLNFKDQRPEKWLSRFQQAIDQIFFERLFAQLDMDEDDAADAWARELIDLAREQLDDAIRSTPQPSIRRYRVESAAYATFFGCAKKNFPDLYSESTKGADHAENGD